MTANHRSRRGTAVGAVTALLAASLVGATATTAATAAAPAPPAAIDTVDYLAATYEGLAPGHVFETVTFERLEWLLNQEGTFAFHIGGPDDENTRATIGLIDEVAKEYGVETVYTFDPRLDGDLLDVRDPSAVPITATGQAQFAELWTRIVDSYLNADTAPQFDGDDEDPYLFVYDKDRLVGGPEDRIVAAHDQRRTAAELAEEGATDAYRSLVGSLFNAVSTVEGGEQVSGIDSLSQFEFYRAEVNRRHTASYPNATTHGGTILDDSDAAGGWRIQSVTYPELQHILASEGDYVILFGGTWCHNTRAVYKAVNDYARKNGVTTVYNFDLSLDSTGNAGTNYKHIRDHSIHAASGEVRRPAYLYGDLVNTFLPNLVTQYEPTSTSASQKVNYYPGGDTAQELQTARKLQVPFVIEYDKDRVDDGQPAPVARQWIQRNVDPGTSAVSYREYMTEWWYTIGLPGAQVPDGNGHLNAVAFAQEAVRKLGVFFGDLPGAPAQTAVSASSTVADGRATLSAQVSWYGGLASDAEGTVEFFTAAHESLGSTTVTEGVAEHAVTGLASGQHSVYAVFTPSAGSDYRGATSGAVTFTIPEPTKPDATPAASTTKIAVSTGKYGKAAKATVTVTNAAGKAVTGQVTLTGAGKAQTRTVAGGKATFTLPKTLKVKTYRLKASFTGNAELKASEGTKSFKVTKGAVKKVALKVTKKPTGKKKGKATVTVSSAKGLVKATGKVTVRLTKGKKSKTVRATLSKGTRKIALPKLAKGTWKVTVTFAGNASYAKAKSKTFTVKVKR